MSNIPPASTTRITNYLALTRRAEWDDHGTLRKAVLKPGLSKDYPRFTGYLGRDDAKENMIIATFDAVSFTATIAQWKKMVIAKKTDGVHETECYNMRKENDKMVRYHQATIAFGVENGIYYISLKDNKKTTPKFYLKPSGFVVITDSVTGDKLSDASESELYTKAYIQMLEELIKIDVAKATTIETILPPREYSDRSTAAEKPVKPLDFDTGENFEP